jgi:biotin transport system permease protein
VAGGSGGGQLVVGIYTPGTSPLHRCPAGAKLLGLSVGLLVLGLWRTWQVTLVAAAVVALGGVVSGVGLRRLGSQLRPVLWVAVAIGGFQVWAQGWPHALIVVGSLLVAVAAAALVTLTTRTDELVAVIAGLLSPLHGRFVDPERVALTLALAVRAVPVLVGLVDDVRDARRARGAERSLRALVVPVVIRTVRHADQVGEALAARGLDDD